MTLTSHRELSRCQLAEGAVRTVCIVVDAPAHVQLHTPAPCASWTLGTTFWNWQVPKGQLFGGSGLGGPTTQATVVAGPDCAVAYHFAPAARGLMNQRLSPLGDVQRRCPGAVIFRSTSNSMVAGARLHPVP